MGTSLVAFFSYGGRTAAVARRVAEAHWAPGSGGPGVRRFHPCGGT